MGRPWLGASARRTLRGTTASKTSSPKCRRTSAATSAASRVLPSTIVRSIPARARRGFSRARGRARRSEEAARGPRARSTRTGQARAPGPRRRARSRSAARARAGSRRRRSEYDSRAGASASARKDSPSPWPRELDGGAGELGARRDEVEVRESASRCDDLVERCAVEQVVLKTCRSRARRARRSHWPVGRGQRRASARRPRRGRRRGSPRSSSCRRRPSGSRARRWSPRPHPSQARGRFLAIPGRRGNRSGVGPRLAEDEQPRQAPSRASAATSAAAARATAASSAHGPTKRSAAPPGRTSGRHHSAATGGGGERPRHRGRRTHRGRRPARAPPRARRRPRRSANSLGHALRGTRTCGRCDSSRTTSRSGRAAASGNPGEPPPEPTSTTGPVLESGAAASASSTWTRRASRRVRDRREPGRRQKRREPALEPGSSDAHSGRADDDGRFGSVPSLEVSTPSRSSRCTWTILRSTAVIGSSATAPASRRASRGRAVGELLERAPGADRDSRRRPRRRSLRSSPPGRRSRWRGTGSRRSSAPAFRSRGRGPGRSSDAWRRSSSSVIAIAQPARRAPLQTRSRSSRSARGRRVRAPRSPAARREAGASSAREDLGGLVADAEQPALALGDDDEADARLVDSGKAPLELPERRPLRLADGLPGCLDVGSAARAFSSGTLIAASAGPSSCACAPVAAAAAAPAIGCAALPAAVAPSPAGSRLLGRRPGRALRRRLRLGHSRRVTRPWPTVQRFVVTQ